MSREERYIGHPSDPAEHVCEFCDEPATQVNTLVKYKLYVYTCDDHHDYGERSVAKAPKTREPREKQDTKLWEDAA